MLNQYNSKQQEQVLLKVRKKSDDKSRSNRNIESLGDWDSRIAQADPDPDLITNPYYWGAYCQGMYSRYLKKYGINQSN